METDPVTNQSSPASVPVMRSNLIRERNVYVLFGLLIACGLVIVTLIFVKHVSNIELAEQERRGKILANVLEGHVSRTLSSIDATLDLIGGVLAKQTRTDTVISTDTQSVIDGAILNAPYLRSISVVDMAGQVLASSNRRNAGVRVILPLLGFRREVIDRIEPGTVLFARDLSDLGAKDPAGGDRAVQMIPFAKTVNTGDRTLILLAVVNPGYFFADYNTTQNLDLNFSAVFADNGDLLGTSANADFAVGQKFPQLPMVDMLKAGRTYGMFRSTQNNRRNEAEQYIVNFKAIRNVPLVAVVGVSETEVLQQLAVDSRPLKWLGLLAACLVLAYTIMTYRTMLQRDRVEHDLRDSEERWGFALEGSGDGVWDVDLKNGRSFYSRQWKALLGYEENEISSKSEEWSSRVHPDDLAVARAAEQLHFSDGSSSFSCEIRMRCKDGSYKWIMDRGRVVSRDADGAPLRMIGTHTDVSKHYEREATLRHAQQQLQVSEARYRSIAHEQDTLITNAPMAIMFVSNGVIVRANAELAKRFGFRDTNEMVGRKTHDLFRSEAEYDAFGEIAIPLLTKNLPVDVEWKMQNQSGADFLARFVGRALPSSSYGRGAVWVIEDVTTRQQMIEAIKTSEARLRRLMNSSLIGIAQGTLTGTLVEANDEFLTLIGYSREQVTSGRLAWEVLTPVEFRAAVRKARKQIFESGNSVPFEMELNRQDGTRVPVLLGLSRVEGSDDELVAFVLDLTERRRVDRIKSEFISVVSHELRTPITSIRGSLGLLEGGALGELPPKALDLVKIANQNSQRLIALVNDILDMDKLLSGKMTIQADPVNLITLVEQSIEANAAYAASYKVRYTLSAHPAQGTVVGDADRLMQVMANLLSNAAKFSRPAGVVDIRIVPDGQLLRVEVEDRGVGIPVAFQSRMFEAFAQADGTNTRQHGGTGLGLNISRNLIEKMGGDMGYLTEVGQGTTVWFTVPLALQLTGAMSETRIATASINDRL